MVYTLTVNPSVDYVLHIDNLNKGFYNRTNSETLLAGGRGINVCRILNSMGVKNIALGFTGGQTGEMVKNILTKEEIAWTFIEIDGETRINIRIMSRDDDTTINANGPTIDELSIRKMYDKLNRLTEVDYLFLSGSVRQEEILNLYKDLGRASIQSNTRLVVDSDGDTLREMLEFKPFFIKPSIDELGTMFNTTILTMDAVLKYGKMAVDMGAENVIVSLKDKDGPVYFNKDRILTANLPKGTLVNSNGVGDAMVGAFIGELINSGDIERSFKMSIGAGSATAYSEDICNYDEMKELYDSIEIKEL